MGRLCSKVPQVDRTNPTLWMSLISLLTATSDVPTTSKEYENAVKSVTLPEMIALLWQQYLSYMQTCSTDPVAIEDVRKRVPLPFVSKKRKFQDHRGRGHGHQ